MYTVTIISSAVCTRLKSYIYIFKKFAADILLQNFTRFQFYLVHHFLTIMRGKEYYNENHTVKLRFF